MTIFYPDVTYDLGTIERLAGNRPTAQRNGNYAVIDSRDSTQYDFRLTASGLILVQVDGEPVRPEGGPNESN